MKRLFTNVIFSLVFIFTAFLFFSVVPNITKPARAAGEATSLTATQSGCTEAGTISVTFSWTAGSLAPTYTGAPVAQYLDYSLNENIDAALNMIPPYAKGVPVTWKLGTDSITVDGLVQNVTWYWRVNTDWGGYFKKPDGSTWYSSTIQHFQTPLCSGKGAGVNYAILDPPVVLGCDGNAVSVKFSWTPAPPYLGNVYPVSQYLDYSLSPDINTALTNGFAKGQDVTGMSSVILPLTQNTDWYWRVNTNWGGFLGGWISSPVSGPLHTQTCSAGGSAGSVTGGTSCNGFFDCLTGIQSPTTAFSENGLVGLIFTSILPIVIGLGGFITVIMIIISGFQFITANGNPETAGGARGRLTFAVIGFALLILAYAITQIVDYIFLRGTGVF